MQMHYVSCMKRRTLNRTLAPVRVDRPLAEAVTRAAKRAGVSEAQIVRRALRRELGLNGTQEETS